MAFEREEYIKICSIAPKEGLPEISEEQSVAVSVEPSTIYEQLSLF